MDGFICLPVSPFICLPLSPRLDAWHGSLGGRVHLSPCVSLHLSPVVSPPGCLARLSGWTGSFVSLCLPSFVSRCLPAWMPGSLGGRVHLSPCVSLHLSPVVSPPGRVSGWTGSFVSLCLPSFVSRCLPAWMPGTALWVDGFICLPVSPFICLPLSPRLDAWHGSLGGRVHLSPCVSLHLSPVVSPPGCLARLSGWTGSLSPVSPFICLPLSPPAWMPGTALWVDAFVCLPVSLFICLPLSPRLDAWHGSLGDGFICLPLSPFIWPRLSPSLDMPVTALWGGGVHLSPFVSLHLSPVVSQPGCLARGRVSLHLSPVASQPGCLAPSFVWHGSLGFVSLHLSPVVSQPGCLARLARRTDSLVSFCLPSFVSRCLPAWMPGTALWVDSFTCLPLSPFISFGSPCLPAWMSVTAFICLPLSWHGSLGSFVSLCLPSFVSRCLPAWMPGTAFWVDGFICLPVSPFICLPLSPRLDAWHGSLGGRVYLSPCVSLHLSPVVSPPGCLARLSGWTGSFVSLCLPSFVSRCLPPGCLARLSEWTGSFVSLCLPSFVSRCLPASRLDAWHGSLGGRVRLSPCVSLHLSPVVSPPGCLTALGSFVSLCLPSFVSRCLPAWSLALWTGSFVSLSLPSFVSRCLRVDAFVCLSGFTCLPLSPFICLPLSPSLDAWMPGTALWGGGVHLSPCVSLHLSPSLDAWRGSGSFVSPFICLPLSPSLDAWVDRFTCLPLSPFICRPLSPSLDLARLSGWTGLSPSFVSRSLPAWMPGTALWVDGFICLRLSPLISPVVSQPGCLARLSG